MTIQAGESGNTGRSMPEATPCSETGAVIRSTALMNGIREVTILHAGERYRLRITASNKLILTK